MSSPSRPGIVRDLPLLPAILISIRVLTGGSRRGSFFLLGRSFLLALAFTLLGRRRLAAVVGHVPAAAFELDGGGGEQAVGSAAAVHAGSLRRVAELLDQLEPLAAAPALVFVQRHWLSSSHSRKTLSYHRPQRDQGQGRRFLPRRHARLDAASEATKPVPTGTDSVLDLHIGSLILG